MNIKIDKLNANEYKNRRYSQVEMQMLHKCTLRMDIRTHAFSVPGRNLPKPFLIIMRLGL